VEWRTTARKEHIKHAYLAAVTLHMEVTVQGHNTNSFLLAWSWHYRLGAHTAAWSKLPVKNKRRTKANMTQREL